MIMQNFLLTLLLWALLIISAGLFYMAATVTFSSAFVNIAMGVSAVFFFSQALGMIDKKLHLGENNNGDSKNDEKEKS